MSDVSRRRPWLAVLLAIVVSGLGHAYLRRWGRALAWYVAITTTLVFLVPDAALDQLFARELPPIGDIGPALVVIGASIVDAYVVAIRNNREYERQQRAKTAGAGVREGSDREAELGGEKDRFDGDAATASTDRSVDPTGSMPTAETLNESTPTAKPGTVDCPHCGRETDPEIDFCHWCTEPLDRADDT